MPPPLPPVQTDTALAIFAHSSIRSPEQNDSAERLSFIGGKVLQMVNAETLFEKKPTLDAVQLNIEFESTTSNASEFYQQWVSFYKLREKVACLADQRAELEEPGMTQHLFDAYVGAVYAEQGYFSTKAWIQLLVDPNSVSTSVGSNGSSKGASMDNPAPPTASPPPLPNNSSGTGPTGAFLAKFNEKAMQLGVSLEWNATKAGGTAHQPTWKVDCKADGMLKGTGVGKSKQQAKEEAARHAYQALGWSEDA